MSRYRDAFETIVERGEPVGAAELLARIEAELAGTAGTRSRPSTARISGPALAAASFLIVLLLGVGLIALAPWGQGPAEAGDRVRFEVVPEGVARPVGVRGGFIAMEMETGRLVFSADLVDWEPIDLPQRALVGWVGSTARRWFVMSADGGTIWAGDARGDWEAVEVPAALAERVSRLSSDSQVVLAQIEDPFDELPVTLWRLDAALDWERLSPAGLPDGVTFDIVGREDGPGFVASADGGQGFTAWTSSDGSSWIGGGLVAVPGGADAVRLDTRIVPAGEAWIAVSVVSGEDGAGGVHVYTSSDGLTWAEQPEPPWNGPFSQVAATGGVVIAVLDDEAWITSDGITWDRAFTFTERAWIEAGSVIEGQAVVLWSSIRADPGIVTTTVTMPTVDPDPAGAALQDEILADGVVTREEFESAVAGMVACMEERGIEVTDWSVDPDGGYGFSVREADTGGVDSFCQYSYLERITEEMARR